ncbi:MAG: P-loop NTPase fold protein [Candidatus Micrarchaeota archaeon]
MINPFDGQGPTSPKYYANRKDLLGTFTKSVTAVVKSKGVTRPLNIGIMGRWGIGKTSTLYKFRDILENELNGGKVFSTMVSLKPACCEDADTFSATVLETIFTEYESSSGLSRKIKDFLNEEKNAIRNWKLSKLSLNPELERKQKSVSAVNFKETLLRLWKKLESNGVDLAIIMLDDIHYVLTQGKGEILFDLRTDMQALSAAGARFMFIITGPVTLYPEMRDKAEPFTRLFERFDLEPFDFDGTKELIEKPLAVEKIKLEVSDEVIRKIHEITAGHPYFITLAVRDLLNQKQEGRLSAKEFIESYPDLVDHFARIKFNDDYARATDAEKEVLRKLAASNKQEVAPNDIGGAAVTKFLERLVSKDLVLKIARGKYAVYNPLFKEYLRRKKA